jgi:hypothetical protein
MITLNIPTTDEQIKAIKAVTAITDAEEKEIRARYEWMIERAKQYIPRNPNDESLFDDRRNIRVDVMLLTDTGSYQMVAHNSVTDLDKPQGHSFNFHFQETSRWLFGFGIVFDKETHELSMHT